MIAAADVCVLLFILGQRYQPENPSNYFKVAGSRRIDVYVLVCWADANPPPARRTTYYPYGEVASHE